MIEYKGEKIEVSEYVPNKEGYQVTGGELDFSVSSRRVVYQASNDNYGLAFAPSPQQAVDLVKELIDSKK